MIHTGMMGMVVITGNRESDIKSIASVLNEIGVGGLNIEVATDNEGYLKDLMAKGLTKSNMRSFHWRNISEYRPQAKGIERAVVLQKKAFTQIGSLLKNIVSVGLLWNLLCLDI